MSIFDTFMISATQNEKSSNSGLVPGPNKKNGGHDHRSNTGNDRTPAQKRGDSERSKSKGK